MLESNAFAYQAETAYLLLDGSKQKIIDHVFDLLPKTVEAGTARIYRNECFPPIEYYVTVRGLKIIFVLKSNRAVIVDIQ